MPEQEIEVDMVRVHITASQRVYYDQTVTMSRKDWDELKRTDETSMECGVTSPLGDTLDLRDVDEGGDFEDFEMEVVDENGKPVGDCYIGELDIDDGIENVSFDDEDDDES